MAKQTIGTKYKSVNKSLLAILESLYMTARTVGAMVDGGVVNGALRPSKWREDVKAAANESATRVLRDVVHKAIKPYEVALQRYAVYHLPDCSTWQDKDCDCGLEYLQSILRSNQMLAE